MTSISMPGKLAKGQHKSTHLAVVLRAAKATAAAFPAAPFHGRRPRKLEHGSKPSSPRMKEANNGLELYFIFSHDFFCISYATNTCLRHNSGKKREKAKPKDWCFENNVQQCLDSFFFHENSLERYNVKYPSKFCLAVGLHQRDQAS